MTHLYTLEAHIQSDLKWSISPFEKPVFWHLDLGLFDTLSLPLSDEGQFRSLVFAIEHFRETVWKDNPGEGVCFYKGPTSMSSRDEYADFLDLLATYMPYEANVHILLDLRGIDDPAIQAMLIAKDVYAPLQLAVRGATIPHSYKTYDDLEVFSPVLQKPPLGLLIPAKDCVISATQQERLRHLQSTQTPFRIISETFLTNEWDELDTLIVDREALSEEGMRKLQGFMAAGGSVDY